MSEKHNCGVCMCAITSRTGLVAEQGHFFHKQCYTIWVHEQERQRKNALLYLRDELENQTFGDC